MRTILVALWMSGLLVLSACGQASTPAEEQPGQMPTAEELGLPATMEMEFVAAEQVQTTPSTLQTGEGYSIYIPDTGWRKDVDREDRIPTDVWESTVDEEVEVSVSRYGSMPMEEAVTDFLEEHDDYVFRDLLLGSGEVTEPLEGVDEEGDVLKFMMKASKTGTYIVSWEYREPLSAPASQAEQIVRTFVLM